MLDGDPRLIDIYQGSSFSSSSPRDFTMVNDVVYFVATDNRGAELWKTDGSSEGTELIHDLTPGALGSSIDNLTNYNGVLFFTANALNSGKELWKSDGTAEGTQLVKDIRPGTDSFGQGLSAAPQELTVAGSTLYFTAIDDESGRELWKSNGTAESTARVKDICPGSPSGFSILNNDTLTNVNGVLFFAADYTNDFVSNTELWRTDGTDGGTIIVSQIIPFWGSDPRYFVSFKGELFFTAHDASIDRVLWKSNGNPGEAVIVSNTCLVQGPFTCVNDNLFFRASDSSHGNELWKSNGTAEGTQLVKDIRPGSQGSDSTIGQFLINVNGILVFTATDGPLYGDGLWTSDGSEINTFQVAEFPSIGSDAPSLFGAEPAAVGNSIFFSARRPSEGEELWKMDLSTGATTLYDVRPVGIPQNGSYPSYLENIQGTLFFNADDGVHGRELWVIDKASPEIGVFGNAQQIDDNPDQLPSASNDTDFGDVSTTNGSVLRTFSIVNTGDAPLTLNGSQRVQITGLHAGDFSIVQLPSENIAPSQSTSFQVSFDPRAVGLRSAIISITNDDIDENPYEFAIQGRGVVTSDIVVNSLTASGGTNLVFKYTIVDGPIPSFSVGFYRSSDTAYGFDTQLYLTTVNSLNDLTTGQHEKVFTIGGGSNQVGFPGAIAVETNTEYFILAVADPLDLVAELDVTPSAEDNTTVFVGAYHLAGYQLYVHGSEFADSIIVGPVGEINFNGTFTYTAPNIIGVRIRAHAGADQIDGLAAQRVLWIHGGADNDSLTGGPGNDTLNGGAGDDQYLFDTDLFLGNDSLIDSAGNDTLDFSQGSLGITNGLDLAITSKQNLNSNISLFLGAIDSFENVVGTVGDDKITGNQLQNNIDGGSGNDWIAGRGADDFLNGGLGDDVFLFDTDEPLGLDSLADSGGWDSLDFREGNLGIVLDLLLTAQDLNPNLSLSLAPGEFESVFGTSGDDEIYGNEFSNGLSGLDGNDLLVGREGNDAFGGGPGDDTLDGGDGNDRYAFDADLPRGIDEIIDSNGVDLLDFTGSDTGITVNLNQTSLQTLNANLKLILTSDPSIEGVNGTLGDDTITGNGRDNILDGRAGNDTYKFNADIIQGTDQIIDSSGWDKIDFLAGQQKVIVKLNSTEFQDINSNLRLKLDSIAAIEAVTGTRGNDTLIGNSLANRLSGGGGNDILTGGDGNDELLGGAGNDRYAFDADLQLGEDKILNENQGQGIDFLDFQATTSKPIRIDLGDLTPQEVAFGTLKLELRSPAIIEGVRGGSQDDIIIGNGTTNILLGMAGNDDIRGLGERDVLVGGKGLDTVSGDDIDDLLDDDDDLLIGGEAFDTDLAAHIAFLAAWDFEPSVPSSIDYANRLMNLRAGVKAGGITKQLCAGVTVLDDATTDIVSGAGGRDWFFARTPEADEQSNEEIEDWLISTSNIVGRIFNGDTPIHVSIEHIAGPQQFVQSNQTTWIVIHGKSSSPAASNIYNLAQAIDGYPASDQVLTVNWSLLAASLVFDWSKAAWIPHVAAWAACALKYRVGEGSLLNLVGHSWGAYVAADIAKAFLPTKVNSIVALDPAADAWGGQNLNAKDFRTLSDLSWAFYSSVLGSATMAAKAHESFVINGSGHSTVVDLFANMQWSNNLNQNTGVSQYFSLTRLLIGVTGPWKHNMYAFDGGRAPGSQFEARLAAGSGGTVAVSVEYFDILENRWVTRS